MTLKDSFKTMICGHRITLVVILCFFGLCVWSHFPSKQRQRKETDEKIYLIHSDELIHDRFSDNPEAQIAKGHVQFRHKGATLGATVPISTSCPTR